MAQGAPNAGLMDIKDQRETYHGFLVATVWVCGQIAQWVALLTLAFAVGQGWWAGLGAFIVLGALLGVLFRMPAAYWAAQIVLWGLMIVGGALVPAISGMMG